MISAAAGWPARLLCLEARDRGADRRERPVFVLLLAEAVGIRAVRRVDCLLQQVGKVLVEAGLCGRGFERT